MRPPTRRLSCGRHRRTQPCTCATRFAPGPYSRGFSASTRRRRGVAAIIRSAGVLCGVKRLGARLCGIPDGVAAKLQRLLWMYGIADPEPPRAVQEVPDDDDEEDRDKIDIGKESLPRPPLPPASGPSCPAARQGTRTRLQQRAHTTCKHRRQTALKPSKRRKKAGGTESDWMYGPKSTANDVALWFRLAGLHTHKKSWRVWYH